MTGGAGGLHTQQETQGCHRSTSPKTMSCVPGGDSRVRAGPPPNRGRAPPGRGRTDDGHHVRQHVALGHAIQPSLWSTGTPVRPPPGAPPNPGEGTRPPQRGRWGEVVSYQQGKEAAEARGDMWPQGTLGWWPRDPSPPWGGWAAVPPQPKTGPIPAAPTRCANPGALILQRYGRLLPSDTRYTPNSPCGDMGTGLVTQGHGRSIRPPRKSLE